MSKIQVFLMFWIVSLSFSQVKINDTLSIVKNKAVEIKFNPNKWNLIRKTNHFPLSLNYIIDKDKESDDIVRIDYVVDCYKLFPEDSVHTTIEELKKSLNVENSFLYERHFGEKPYFDSLSINGAEIKSANINLRSEYELNYATFISGAFLEPFTEFYVNYYNYHRSQYFLYVEKITYSFSILTFEYENIEKLYLEAMSNKRKGDFFEVNSENNYYVTHGIKNTEDLKKWYAEKKLLTLNDKLNHLQNFEFKIMKDFKKNVNLIYAN